MKKFRIILLSFVVATGLFASLAFANSNYASAATLDTPEACVEKGTNDDSCDDGVYDFRQDPACQDGNSEDCLAGTPLIKWIEVAINLLSSVIVLIVAIMIVVGGIQYASAADNAQSVTAAKQKISNAIIGLLAYLLLYAFVQWLIPGGVFDTGSQARVTRQSTVPAPSQQSVPGSGSSGGGSSPASPASPAAPATNSPAITRIAGLDNFRDAGASGFLKTGVLYRSDKLQDANADQLESLLSGGVIIDLRTADMRRKYPDVSVSGVRAANYAIHGTEDYTEFVLLEESRDGFKKAITALANEDGPTLIHCTHGKDRTGWAVAMVMYAVGASNSEVMTEYLKSPDVSEAMLKSGLSKARDEYGSIQKYIKNGLGLSDQTISKLKTKLAV